MRQSTDLGPNCRFLIKAAIGDTPAPGFRGVAYADSAPLANADCRFPRPALVSVDGVRASGDANGQAAPGAPCSPVGAPVLVVATEAQPLVPDATPANVARAGATAPDVGMGRGGCDSPFSPRVVAVPTAVSHGEADREMDEPKPAGEPAGADPEAQAGGSGRFDVQDAVRPGRVRLGDAAVRQGTGAAGPDCEGGQAPLSDSTGLPAHGVEDVLVAGERVPGRGGEALVPRGPLHAANVPGPLEEVRQARVPELVEAEEVVEARAALPHPEHVADGPKSDPLPPAGDEERCGGLDALAASALPGDELRELVPGVIGQEDLLGCRVIGGSLEDAERDAPAYAPVLMENVTHVEPGELVLAQGGAEGDAQQRGIPEAGRVLPRDLEQPFLFGGCGGRATVST